MNERCRPWRTELGMLAGGLLDDHERLALQAHLDGCAECRAELAEIAPMVRLLPHADPERVTDQAVPATRLTLQVFTAVAAERRARNRRRLIHAAASLSVAAAFTLGLVVLTAPDPARPIEFAQAPPGVTATASLEDRAWGTQVQLAVAGLSDGVEHAVWLERADGSRVPAGTFTADGARTLSVTLAAAAPAADAVALGISDGDGDTVLRAPTPAPTPREIRPARLNERRPAAGTPGVRSPIHHSPPPKEGIMTTISRTLATTLLLGALALPGTANAQTGA